MVTSAEWRHVPTGRLALLAQRARGVFASPSTWYRLAREHGWPRLRGRRKGPLVGIRVSRPEELWHIDKTVIRIVDGTRVCLHAVIDNFSRRILAWRVIEAFGEWTSANLLVAAGRGLGAGARRPTLLADAGVENRNRFVDPLIEAWWRSLKHQWLFLHPLDSAAMVRRLVEFYDAEHNLRLPHSAFGGQTPEEMYFGTEGVVKERLAAGRRAARLARVAANRTASCSVRA